MCSVVVVVVAVVSRRRSEVEGEVERIYQSNRIRVVI